MLKLIISVLISGIVRGCTKVADILITTGAQVNWIIVKGKAVGSIRGRHGRYGHLHRETFRVRKGFVSNESVTE